MGFRQLFDKASSTYTYLLWDEQSKQAMLVDPVIDRVERDLGLLEELGLTLTHVAETHAHADHVTGANSLRERTGAKTLAGKSAGVKGVDVAAEHGERVALGKYEIEVRHTPGHTAGCVSYVLRADGSVTRVLTGDCLLIRGCGRTDFQGGDARKLYQSVHQQIYTLPDDCYVYPGHDYRGFSHSTVGEEKVHNLRLNTQVSEEEFVTIMASLKLQDPALLHMAVPANMEGGKGQVPKPDPKSIASVDDVTSKELAEFRVIDVRRPDEFHGPLGHIHGSTLIPLKELPDVVEGWPRATRMLLVCRSGKRSAQACRMLKDMGFETPLNLRGGMIAYRKKRES